MNALTRMHDALRPHGLLLDIRPAASNAAVEVQVNGRVTRLGYMDESRRRMDVQSAEAALRVAIDARQFVRECKTSFAFIIHFDAVDSWLEYVAERWKKAAVAAEVVARARIMLPQRSIEAAPPGDELRVIREIDAVRLRRL